MKTNPEIEILGHRLYPDNVLVVEWRLNNGHVRLESLSLAQILDAMVASDLIKDYDEENVCLSIPSPWGIRPERAGRVDYIQSCVRKNPGLFCGKLLSTMKHVA